MANSKTVKSNSVTASVKDSSEVTTSLTDSNVVAKSPSILTVVVVDEKGQPTSGAHVSIAPSDASGTTNNAGEIQFKIGSATKYEITASYDSSTVTVPYYVTPNGATRLVVNPVYVRNIEKQLHPSFFSSGVFLTAGIILGVIVVFFVVLKFFRRHRK